MYLFKKLTRDILKNKMFVFMLFLLCIFTSFMYFFVQFSIDGNIQALNKLSALNENQILYQNALHSNIILAQNFLVVLSGLTSFVFVMFFYRFYKSNGKQIGCLRALGYKNNTLRSHFTAFTAIVSFFGAIIGIVLGYFASDILLNANAQSYSVTNLIKSINLLSIIIGLIAPPCVFCLVTFLSYEFIRKLEVGNLIAGTNKEQKFSWIQKLMNRFIKILPVKNKFPLRIAFRKPFAILLIFTAVMGFTVMFVMGYSLNNSSQKIFSSQIEGHKYKFETSFNNYRTGEDEKNDTLYYLAVNGVIQSANGQYIEQQIIGIEQNHTLLELKNEKREALNNNKQGMVYISPELRELHGFKINDEIIITIKNQDYTFVIKDIAVNAKLKSIYLSKTELSQILNLPLSTYNGSLSMEQLSAYEGQTVSYEQKLEELDRASVSNRTSAVINQSIGCIVGCILIYLALLLNFQDSFKDMMILHMMGHKPKEIRKLLVDVYKPIILSSFLIALAPSILIAQSVQKSLSIQTGDYMPFGINYFFVIAIFILLIIIYSLVQISFNSGIRKIIKEENIAEYISVQ